MVVLDYAKALVCVFVLVILQLSSAPQLSPFGGGPDLVAILVVALALWRGLELAAVTGFAGGLLIDAVLFRHLGLTSLSYVACAWVVATFANRGEAGAGMLEPAPPRPLPWVVAGALLVQVALVAVEVLLGYGYELGYLLWHQIVPSILETTVLALILLPLLRLLFRPTRMRRDVPAAATV